MAELSESLTSYHYAGNNPVMDNDPTGNCDPSVDEGCPINQIFQPEPQPFIETDTETGSGGGGDPGTVYSGNSVPSASTSYGGEYNSEAQSGTTGINFIQTLNGNWEATYNGLNENTYDKQIVEDSWVAESGFSYIRIGYEGMGDSEAASSESSNEDATSQGGTQIFGASLTTQTALSTGNSDSFVGNYLLELKYTQYTGAVNDKGKGIINYNTTIRNGERSHDASIDVGKLSLSMGLTSRSIGYNGYSFSFDVNIFNGITYGFSHTDKNGNIAGSEYTINPFKIVPAVATAAYYYAPYWVPIVLAF